MTPHRREQPAGRAYAGDMQDPAGLEALFARARERLASVPREALGRLELPGGIRRMLGGQPRIVPAGEAWRVGVLLIGETGVFEVGDVVRAAEPRRRGYAAEATRQRAEAGAMCVRGGFAAGTAVNVDFHEIDLDAVANGGASGPLAWQGDVLTVRWAPGGATLPLAAYLDERVATIRGE